MRFQERWRQSKDNFSAKELRHALASSTRDVSSNAGVHAEDDATVDVRLKKKSHPTDDAVEGLSCRIAIVDWSSIATCLEVALSSPFAPVPQTLL
jgi:hypothetical protein